MYIWTDDILQEAKFFSWSWKSGPVTRDWRWVSTACGGRKRALVTLALTQEYKADKTANSSTVSSTPNAKIILFGWLSIPGARTSTELNTSTRSRTRLGSARLILCYEETDQTAGAQADKDDAAEVEVVSVRELESLEGCIKR
ncbi:hypothetical protein Hamer_G023271 [Homarus americanus]|uniref:Uncharacterized protein n=1 Tax=Homarus americanus TaxID=6706 RepID=A0A8J5JRC0_HOMAM|nr:hypothetical protein Hamer_G023271 [Homarus americanus]